MTRTSPPAASDEFEIIEAAVMETARGRWFLAEFARRTRAAETAALLQAIDRLENALKAGEQSLTRMKQAADAGHGERRIPIRSEIVESDGSEAKILYFS